MQIEFTGFISLIQDCECEGGNFMSETLGHCCTTIMIFLQRL